MSKKFKRKGAVTLPPYSFKNRDVGYLRIESEIVQGKTIRTDGKPTDKPADICKAVDLETGEMVTFVVPTVVKAALVEEVGDYIGKCFEIEKIGKREGKRYVDYAVYEIECPA